MCGKYKSIVLNFLSHVTITGPQLCARVTYPCTTAEPEDGGDADGNCRT